MLNVTLLAAALAASASPAPRHALAAPDQISATVLTAGAPVSRVADSLVTALKRLESGRPDQGGDAAMLLGQVHFARGEYRLAADAFARAAARLDPTRKPEARYWVGLSWLGLGDPNQARAALEEVADSDSPRRALARLGVAEAWELAGRPERARQILEALLAGDPGEAGPPALARLAALADAAHQPELARTTRERLMRDYPASDEAAGARLAPAAAPAALAGGWTVEIGAFSDAARARSLAEAARKSGFAQASVVDRGVGTVLVHVVVLGRYDKSVEARREAERAATTLGVNFRVIGP
jgi:tetratricopeptide (TPR) repeat protein